MFVDLKHSSTKKEDIALDTYGSDPNHKGKKRKSIAQTKTEEVQDKKPYEEDIDDRRDQSTTTRCGQLARAACQINWEVFEEGQG